MNQAFSTAAALFDQPGAAHRFSVAPMMECTDRHYRYLARLLSRRALLYTEMVTAQALLRNSDLTRFLAHDPAEHPLALQLGGSDPAQLAKAAALGEAWGYDEINLNVGCPSDKVTDGRFGACLMAEPDLVAAGVKAMREAVSVPVTVKTRIGIDDQDSNRQLDEFVAKVSAAGCTTFIIHARKAWLQGLSPKENREIPPLDYGRVRRLKRDFPHLTIILNGGLKTPEAAAAEIAPQEGLALDGAMLGRAVYDAPYLLAPVDALFHGETAPPPAREAVVAAYLAYAERQIHGGTRVHHVLRHAVGLYHGCPGARAWRQAVTRAGQGTGSLAEVADIAARMSRREPLAA